MVQPSQIRIQAKELTKVFRDRKRGRVVAVDRVSFEASAGEVFGLLGVNGAGKTTTLRLLSTMLKPTSGDALVCGHSLLASPENVRKHIGYMSAATSLYGRLTAREMIEYFGRLHGLSNTEIKSRSQLLFDLFDMKDFLDRRCDKLSSGMRQKVSIVRTVLHDPEVLILDEPTAGLDVLTSRTIVDFIKDCRARKKCVLFSTHRMDEVEKLCDRVGIIHRGRLLACQSLEEFYKNAKTQRVEDAFVQLVGEES